MKKFLIFLLLLPILGLAQTNFTPQFKRNIPIDSLLGYSIPGITGNHWLPDTAWVKKHVKDNLKFDANFRLSGDSVHLADNLSIGSTINKFKIQQTVTSDTHAFMVNIRADSAGLPKDLQLDGSRVTINHGSLTYANEHHLSTWSTNRFSIPDRYYNDSVYKPRDTTGFTPDTIVGVGHNGLVYKVPFSGGGTTTNPLTFSNSGSGDASGTIFNGAVARTISYNSIGAQPQLSGTGFVKASGTTVSYDNSTYLTANQSISFAPTGDVTGSTTGTTSLAPALSIGAGKVTNAMLAGSIDLTSKVTGLLPVANGGTGTASPGIVAGTNVTVSGTWPNQTVNASGGTTIPYAINAATVYNAFGDSYTAGNVGPSITANRFSTLLSTLLGLTENNLGVSGMGIWNCTKLNYANESLGHTAFTSIMIGLNDLRYGGSNALTQTKIQNGYKAIFANHFLDSLTAAGTSTARIVETGTWSNSYNATTVGGKTITGASTTSSGATISWTTYDDNIVVGLIGTDGTLYTYGSATVTIDGVSQGTISENSQTDGITDGGSNDNGRMPFVKLYTGLGQGTHTIVLTTTSATQFVVDYFGNLRQPQNSTPLLLFKIPKLATAGYAVSPANASGPIIDAANAALFADIATYTGKYPVYIANTSTYFTNTGGDMYTDGLHPNDLGHRQIYNAGYAAISAIQKGVLTYNDTRYIKNTSLTNDWTTGGIQLTEDATLQQGINLRDWTTLTTFVQVLPTSINMHRASGYNSIIGDGGTGWNIKSANGQGIQFSNNITLGSFSSSGLMTATGGFTTSNAQITDTYSNITSLGVHNNAGLQFGNATAATSGTPVQLSPGCEQYGRFWDPGSSSSKLVFMGTQVQPISVAGGAANLVWMRNINFGTDTQIATLNTSGDYTTTRSIGSSEITFANAPASPYTGQTVNFSDATTSVGNATAGSGSNHVFARYNGTNWAIIPTGVSSPIIQTSADLTAQTSPGNITTFTVGSSTATFDISMYINVTAVSVDVIQGQITYTDENNTSQTVSLSNLSAIGNSTYNPITIRAKNGTVITVKTNLITGSGSITFDAGARITQM